MIDLERFRLRRFLERLPRRRMTGVTRALLQLLDLGDQRRDVDTGQVTQPWHRDRAVRSEHEACVVGAWVEFDVLRNARIRERR